MDLTKDQKMENVIIRKAVRAFINAGHSVSVWDGEDFALERSTKSETIMNALHATGRDVLYIFDASGERLGFVSLVYGNEPFEVVHDYSTTLEDLMKDANDRAEKMEMEYIY